MTTKRPRKNNQDPSDTSDDYEPATFKRPRRQSDEEWAPLVLDTNHSATNALPKLEQLNEQLQSDCDDWETIETRTVAVECSHVNLRAHQIRQPSLSPQLADAIFNDRLTE